MVKMVIMIMMQSLASLYHHLHYHQYSEGHLHYSCSPLEVEKVVFAVEGCIIPFDRMSTVLPNSL